MYGFAETQFRDSYYCSTMNVFDSFKALQGAIPKNLQERITPTEAVELLKLGALRASSQSLLNRDAVALRSDAGQGQFPFAAVLSCIDSRVPVEQIFDVASGDVFVARVAGNVAAASIVASLEFATELAGAKAILVLGHTRCGAISGACATLDNPKAVPGFLPELLSKIHPSVKAAQSLYGSEPTEDMLRACSIDNVKHTCRSLAEQSTVLSSRIKSGELLIVGALFDVSTGEVKWIESE